jgi:hypothetical protein
MPRGSRSTGRDRKVDGIVALVMAVGRWMAKAPEAEFDIIIV